MESKEVSGNLVYIVFFLQTQGIYYFLIQLQAIFWNFKKSKSSFL